MKVEKLEKKMSYAYPTSSLAMDHGFYQSGCWIVSTHNSQGIELTVKAYSDRSKALSDWEALNMPTHLYCQTLSQTWNLPSWQESGKSKPFS